jgi:hypothetical protein
MNAPVYRIFAVVIAIAAMANEDKATYVFTEAVRYEPKAWLQGRDRFPAGALLRAAGGERSRLLVPAFHASADAAISFDGQRVLFSGKRTAADRWSIWESPLAGGTPRQITRGDADCIRPLYLPDDQVVYTRLRPGGSDLEILPLAGGKPERLTFAPGRYLTNDVLRDGRILFEAERGGVRELFTVYPDGTGVESLRCDHGRDRSDGRQVSSGDVIFSTGGRLARFTSPLATQADVAQPEPEAEGPVAEVSPETWILALRGKDGRFGLYRWNTRTREAALLLQPSTAQAVQPVVVTPRVPPRSFPSARVPTRKDGNLLCLDARISKMPGEAPEIRRVRVYTQHLGHASVLGETAAERDGSFYVQVPADKPLRIELLDGTGHTVRAERDWFWMRPSEQRVCVGCHAGPERSPENKTPEVLLRTIVPFQMLGESQ